MTYNLSGIVVQSISLNQKEEYFLNINNYPSGVYSIDVMNSKDVEYSSQRFIKL